MNYTEYMNYTDGQKVCIGDKVIADNSEGVVVGIIDTKQFLENYFEGWAYLEKGLLVKTKDMGLIHYLETDEDIRLIERGELTN